MFFSDEYFMNAALQLARQAAEAGEIPVGAIVVSNNRIIGKGYNQTERLQDVTAHAEIEISPYQAFAGALVSLELDVPRTCACCGGRGEVWSEPCEPCDGRGQQLQAQRLTVAVPAGVVDGDRFSFNLWLPRGPRTRVDVRVAIRP